MGEIKIHRAPNGKFYAVWHGHPICDGDDGLHYFDTEEAARGALTHFDLALITSDAGETHILIKSPAAGSVTATAA